MICAKVRYKSEHNARQAHRNAGFRVRVYPCPDCHGYYHTANAAKRSGHREDRRIMKAMRYA